VAIDGRLGDQGRRQRVVELDCRLGTLCRPIVDAGTPDMKPHEQDLANLAEELLRLSLAEELFTFVLLPDVPPTNNAMERQLRNPALDRKAGRTNKSAGGAHRRSVIVSVIESLRANLPTFNLATVLEEVGRWLSDGISLFARQWQALLASQTTAAPDTT
jgi:transposase